MKSNIGFWILISLSLPAFADSVTGVPAMITHTTSTDLFDESINHQTGFTISQVDPRLKDLFLANGDSNLCGPTSIANLIPYFKFWRSSAFPNLKLIQDPLTGDYSQVVRDFANRCHTNLNTGTLVVDLQSCLSQYFLESGYLHSKVEIIGPVASGEDQHPVNISDIRNLIQKDFGLLLQITWYTFDPKLEEWTTDRTGHYVSVVGEDYDSSFGEQEIHLKIINPEVDYRGREPQNRWDSLVMLKYPKKLGVAYPDYSNFILEGYEFKGVVKRAFVRNVIGFIPDEP